MTTTPGFHRLRDFVVAMTRLVDAHGCVEEALLEGARPLLAALIAEDDWLPERFAQPDATHYRQFLLHGDPLGRFSLVSFVWGPGQRTPVHDHSVWGLVGVLRGAEISVPYRRTGGTPALAAGTPARLTPRMIEAVSPVLGDIHEVSNAFDDRVSISIHLYGANIGAVRRHVFDPVSGAAKEFISGYSADVVPNLWSSAGR
ncbi:cysteine dioxygenase family protein [Limobrevibacterium gyesilva]|uniref:Cysteine dioxygenase n=1 Tax=Limobrevibacterium gyesilva TaxID=2991712 RepID=A0AA42CFZ1_9PROT|nr:cysteine dioxygenase [Limobrevibacterium gyesilva]MCW3473300.1 cysteine dioxygenase [Limobrevibacterium gyesilva]